jgi:hypothetical protein
VVTEHADPLPRPGEQAVERHPRFGWAGLALGAGAWAVNTQANLALTPLACGSGTRWPVFLSIAMAVIALVGVVVSAIVFRRAGGFGGALRRGDGRSGLFLAGLGMGAGLLFTIVILTQGAAGLVLMGCER